MQLIAAPQHELIDAIVRMYDRPRVEAEGSCSFVPGITGVGESPLSNGFFWSAAA
jgi:hypothetical protein